MQEVKKPSALFSKVDSRYWLKNGKLFKFSGSANYYFQTQIKRRRVSFSTLTSNREAAAKIAAGFYRDVLELGFDAAVTKNRPKPSDSVATVGEYLNAAQAVMDVRPATFAAYGTNLRRIVADILRKRQPRKAKVKAKRMNREAIEQAPLSVLTADALQRWRLDFVARFGGDARKVRSARISANSIVRQARSLFSPRVVKFLSSLRLPEPLPFAGVEMFPRESMRYVSKIDAGAILRKAHEDLGEQALAQFLVILLGVAAGLRRGEIDRLLWEHVDFRKHQIYVEYTEQGALKSEDSRGAVDIDEKTVELLRGFHANKTSEFVIDAPQAQQAESSRTWGLRYRCSAVFEKVNAWLRANGVEGNKPLHTLRKEAGSMIATQHGIFAAAQFLRHSDIKVTAEHYADKKTRTTIDVIALLDAREGMPENITFLDKPPSRKADRRGRNAGCQ